MAVLQPICLWREGQLQQLTETPLQIYACGDTLPSGMSISKQQYLQRSALLHCRTSGSGKAGISQKGLGLDVGPCALALNRSHGVQICQQSNLFNFAKRTR
jgi:hypothetical protein